MSRSYDHGRVSYAKSHRADGSQETRHVLADSMLSHYGARPDAYAEWSYLNYRMGSKETNLRDRYIDHHLLGDIFRDAGRKDGYDAGVLAAKGISRQQQRDAIGARFERAKAAYEATGEHKYLMMQKDMRAVAATHLDADLRQFRVSKK
jgi:hypothetical protein